MPATSLEPLTEHQYASVLHALHNESLPDSGVNGGIFTIERGVLAVDDSDEVRSLSTPAYRDWLATIRANTAHSFTDVGHIRVGIKTTADSVFLRDGWHTLPAEMQPEKELLHPVVTHFEASRWIAAAGRRKKCVLYPHMVRSGKCVPVDLKKYPRAAAYLILHKERLKGRKYLVEGGRKWYEIWVPQNPGHWPHRTLSSPISLNIRGSSSIRAARGQWRLLLDHGPAGPRGRLADAHASGCQFHVDHEVL